MRYSALFFVGMAALLLAGCVTPEQRLASARNQCESFGFVPGTPQYAHCVQKQNNEMIKNDLQAQNNFQQMRIANGITERQSKNI
jgi:hypothetical protein